MYAKLLIFCAIVVVMMAWWRSSLYDQPHISNLDDMGVRATVMGVLPPSGYQPGHLLRDTLKNDKQHTPPYMDIGRYAFRQFLSSSADERDRVLENLARTVRPAGEWVDYLSKRRLEFLCVGESHQDNYRHYLAKHFFPRYPLDILFLEARFVPTKVMRVRADVGEEDVELLSADIADIIRSVKEKNPEVLIVGIEESRGQLSDRQGLRVGSRDESLFKNVSEHYRPGSRSAALLGALHCTQRSNWLYSRLERGQSTIGITRLLNMRLMSEQKDLFSREFTRFLTLLGYPRLDYAIVETQAIDAALHEWFLGLTQNLTRYQAVILFREVVTEDS